MRVWLLILAISFSLPLAAADSANSAREIRGKLIQPAAGPVSIETASGKFEIESDKDSASVLNDPRLAKYEVVLHGHFVEGGRFRLDPFFQKPILALKDGREIHVSYWCPVCSIRSYTPGKCWCCQGETELDFHMDDK